MWKLIAHITGWKEAFDYEAWELNVYHPVRDLVFKGEHAWRQAALCFRLGPPEEKEGQAMKIDGWSVHPSVTTERVAEAVERETLTLDNPGFCLACGAEAGGCEPDARRYRCDTCGNFAVYGASELLICMAI